MDHSEKKAAAAAFRERKSVAGIFSLRCATSGEVWVGRTPNLGAIWNRLTFSLRQGANANPKLQAAWRAHGAESFVFAEVERLEDEALGFVRDSLLKDRLAHWRAALGAEAL
jgi:hypothetical protein